MITKWCYRDIVADTDSPVINDITIFFRSALKIFPFEIIEKKISPVTANFFASNQLIFAFLSYPEVSRNRQKPKRDYMAANDHIENIQGLGSLYNI